ncbi:hypothetical protein [Clostridium botulinum]|uniref:hypothetical protein n=1 Tax=Clostridium botulinum TaxID=1491 RepID=UPI00174AFB01|nr:hypothetical protein [Clostridium botulinum]MBD5589090.1 hypothetical protein [Clostridium botulinum]
MKPNFIKCRLLDIKTQNKGYGADIILKNIGNDENIERIKGKLKEQYEGNSDKDKIYLTRSMTNIDINADTDYKEWCINEEDLNYYVFNKKDVLNFI